MSPELEQAHSQKLLGVVINGQLGFDERIDNLCSKSVLERIVIFPLH